MAATERLIVMMEPAEKAELVKQAKKEDLPTAELARRRLFSRRPAGEDEIYRILASLGPTVARTLSEIDTVLDDVREIRESGHRRDMEVRRELLDNPGKTYDYAAIARALNLNEDVAKAGVKS